VNGEKIIMGLIEFILQKQQEMMTLYEHELLDDEVIVDAFDQIINRILESDAALIKERQKEREEERK
jgi:hypothetical protein